MRFCAILTALLWLILAPLSALAENQQILTDIDGVEHGSLIDSKNRATVLYFVMTDCPISNRFAPEINRICSNYESKGVDCFLVYVDPGVTNQTIRKHAEEYGHDCCAPVNDAQQVLVEKAGATITPEAAVFSPAGEILYRGRINDLYAALGQPRRQARVHDLTSALDQVLAGKAVANPRTKAIGCYIPSKDP